MANTRIRFAAAAGAMVLLLSTPARSDAPADQYEIKTDTVTDRKTGLTWQRKVDVSIRYDFETGMRYCSELSVAGGGWRLPAVKELLTIVDPTRFNPAIDPTAFVETPSELFLTASLRPGSFSKGVWRVHFGSGAAASGDSTLASLVRCVR